MLNRVTLVGRITKDLELRKLEGATTTAVVNFTIALDRAFGKDDSADFIPCSAWGKTAENMAKYLKKGSLISVDGRIQSRNYKAQDGSTRTSIEVVAENVSFLESANARQGQPTIMQETTVDLDKELGSTTTVEVNNDDLPW